jgi:sulfonate transport system substrate-binding protein
LTTPSHSKRPVIAFALAAAIALVVAACGSAPAAAPAPSGAVAAADPTLAELRIDYATYSPPSLVLKKQGWVEDAFKGTAIKWVYSAGSSNALNFLQGNALLSRANGNPIKTVYIYEQPEWTALVVAKDSTAKSITDLKGKAIAAQKGTDPYFFLLRTLNQAGLSQADIQYVNLPHAEGRTALERGQVAAWSGLYRNKDFNTYGFLNGREAFVSQYPAATRTLIGLYERAKQWISDHPDDAAAVLAEAAQLDITVAKRELNDRMNFKVTGIPGDAHIAVLKAVVPIINAEQLANPGTNVDKAVTDLIDGSYAKAVIK